MQAIDNLLSHVYSELLHAASTDAGYSTAVMYIYKYLTLRQDILYTVHTLGVQPHYTCDNYIDGVVAVIVGVTTADGSCAHLAVNEHSTVYC
jgi:hypothetical protein